MLPEAPQNACKQNLCGKDFNLIIKCSNRHQTMEIAGQQLGNNNSNCDNCIWINSSSGIGYNEKKKKNTTKLLTDPHNFFETHTANVFVKFVLADAAFDGTRQNLLS